MESGVSLSEIPDNKTLLYYVNINLIFRTWMEDQDLVDVDVNDDDDYDDLDEEVVRSNFYFHSQ
jgi:hypothetical protein